MTRNQRIRKARPDAEKPKVGPQPNREQGAWIGYQMKLMGFSLISLSKSAGVSFQMVHAVVYGKKTSRRVQKVIARKLGFDSWSDLLAAREGVAA
jgi:lambda repressor-like predicted transcriptional regulator